MGFPSHHRVFIFWLLSLSICQCLIQSKKHRIYKTSAERYAARMRHDRISQRKDRLLMSGYKPSEAGFVNTSEKRQFKPEGITAFLPQQPPGLRAATPVILSLPGTKSNPSFAASIPFNINPNDPQLQEPAKPNPYSVDNEGIKAKGVLSGNEAGSQSSSNESQAQQQPSKQPETVFASGPPVNDNNNLKSDHSREQASDVERYNDGHMDKSSSSGQSQRIKNEKHEDSKGYTATTTQEYSSPVYSSNSASSTSDAAAPSQLSVLAGPPKGPILPDLDGILNNPSGVPNSYTYAGCMVEVDKGKCDFIFSFTDERCKDVISMPRLFESLVTKDLTTIAERFIAVEDFQVLRLTVNKCTKVVTMETSAKEDFNFFTGSDKIKVSKGKLKMSFIVNNGMDFNKLGFNVTGIIAVGKEDVYLEIEKGKGMTEARISMEAKAINVTEFLMTFASKNLDYNSAAKVDKFIDVILIRPQIRGMRDGKGGNELIVSGSAKRISSLPGISATIHMIVQKQFNKASSVAVIWEIRNMEPSVILSTLLSTHLNEVPLVNDLKVDMLLEYSNADMEQVADGVLYGIMKRYITNSAISKGTKLKVVIPMNDVLKKKGILNSIIRDTYIQIHVLESTIDVFFPETALLDLSNLLNALIPKIPDSLFKKVLVQPPNVKVTTFQVSLQSKDINIIIEAPQKFLLGNDMMEVDSAKFELLHKDGQAWEFTLTAQKKIGASTMDMGIRKNAEAYELAGAVSEISTEQLVALFDTKGTGISFIKDSIPNLNFVIEDVKLNSTFRDKLKVQIHGRAEHLGYKGSFEGYIVQGDAKVAFVVGLVMAEVSLNDVAKRIFSKSRSIEIKEASWLSGVSASLVASSTNVDEDIVFSDANLKSNALLKPFHDKSLKEGVVYGSSISLPKDCKKERLCEYMSKTIAEKKDFYLTGIIHTSEMSLRATISGSMKLSNTLTMEDVFFEVIAGIKQTKMSLNGMVKMTRDKQELSFVAKIKLSCRLQLQLTLKLIGTLEKPLMLNYIALADVIMSAAITRANVSPNFELMGTLRVGVSGRELTTDFAGGMDTSVASSFYFYANFGELYFQSIAKSFDIKANLPQLLSSSKFGCGNVVIGSTSLAKGKSIPNLVELEQGLYFKGKLNILGFMLDTEMEVTHPARLAVKATLDVIDLAGGLIRLKSADSKSSSGPSLHIVVASTGVKVKMPANAELLSFISGTVIDISDDGISFVAAGSFLGLFDATVSIKAPYGKLLDIPRNKFIVNTCPNGILDEVLNQAKGIIQAGAKTAEDSTAESNKQLVLATNWYQKALDKLESYKTKMKRKEDQMKKKLQKFEEIKEYLKEDCVAACNKHRMWVGGFGERNCNIAGKKMKCPVWIVKKWLRDDPECLSRCKGGKSLDKIKARQKKMSIVLLQNTIDIQTEILEKVKTFVESARKVIEIAQKASKKLEDVLGDGMKAVDYIKKYGIDDVISISSICIEITLETAKDFCFPIKLNVLLGGKSGKKYAFESNKACLNKDYSLTIAKEIIYNNNFFPKLRTINDDLKAAEELFKKGEVESKDLDRKFADVERTENKLASKVQMVESRTIEDMNGNEMGLKDEEMFMERVVDDELPQMVIRDDHTMQAFRDMFVDENVKSLEPYPIEEDETNDLKNDIPLENTLLGAQDMDVDKCKKTDIVINTYEELLKTINFIDQRNQKQRQKYEDFIKDYVDRLGKVGEELYANCRAMNLTDKQTDDVLFYVNKAEDNIAKYERALGDQFFNMDQISLVHWKNLVHELVSSRKMDMPKFLNILTDESMAISKKDVIINSTKSLGSTLAHADKIVKHLLLGEDDGNTLTSKVQVIKEMAQEISYMRQANHVMCGSATVHISEKQTGLA